MIRDRLLRYIAIWTLASFMGTLSAPIVEAAASNTNVKRAAATVKKSAPVKKAAAPVKRAAAPVKKAAAPVKKSAPVKKAVTAKKPAPKRAGRTTTKPAAPKKATPTPRKVAPVRKAAAPKKAGRTATKPAAPKKVAAVKKAATPAKRAAAPVKKAAAPVKKVAAPVKKAASPVKKAAAPVKRTSAPVKKAAAPVKKVAAPVKKAASPVKKAAAPVKRTSAPVKKAAAPVKRTSAPVKKAAAPVKTATAPAKKTAAPVKRAGRTATKPATPKKAAAPVKKAAAPVKNSAPNPKRIAARKPVIKPIEVNVGNVKAPVKTATKPTNKSREIRRTAEKSVQNKAIQKAKVPSTESQANRVKPQRVLDQKAKKVQTAKRTPASSEVRAKTQAKAPPKPAAPANAKVAPKAPAVMVSGPRGSFDFNTADPRAFRTAALKAGFSNAEFSALQQARTKGVGRQVTVSSSAGLKARMKAMGVRHEFISGRGEYVRSQQFAKAQQAKQAQAESKITVQQPKKSGAVGKAAANKAPAPKQAPQAKGRTLVSTTSRAAMKFNGKALVLDYNGVRANLNDPSHGRLFGHLRQMGFERDVARNIADHSRNRPYRSFNDLADRVPRAKELIEPTKAARGASVNAKTPPKGEQAKFSDKTKAYQEQIKADRGKAVKAAQAQNKAKTRASAALEPNSKSAKAQLATKSGGQKTGPNAPNSSKTGTSNGASRKGAQQVARTPAQRTLRLTGPKGPVELVAPTSHLLETKLVRAGYSQNQAKLISKAMSSGTKPPASIAELNTRITELRPGAKGLLTQKGKLTQNHAPKKAQTVRTQNGQTVKVNTVELVGPGGKSVSLNAGKPETLVSRLKGAGFSETQARQIRSAMNEKGSFRSVNSVRELNGRLQSRGAPRFLNENGTQRVAAKGPTAPRSEPITKGAEKLSGTQVANAPESNTGASKASKSKAVAGNKGSKNATTKGRSSTQSARSGNLTGKTESLSGKTVGTGSKVAQVELTGPGGKKVSLNLGKASSLQTRLERAGFSTNQARSISDSMVENGQIKSVSSLNELRGRMQARNNTSNFVDGQGKLKASHETKSNANQRGREGTRSGKDTAATKVSIEELTRRTIEANRSFQNRQGEPVAKTGTQNVAQAPETSNARTTTRIGEPAEIVAREPTVETNSKARVTRTAKTPVVEPATFEAQGRARILWEQLVQKPVIESTPKARTAANPWSVEVEGASQEISRLEPLKGSQSVKRATLADGRQVLVENGRYVGEYAPAPETTARVEATKTAVPTNESASRWGVNIEGFQHEVARLEPVPGSKTLERATLSNGRQVLLENGAYAGELAAEARAPVETPQERYAAREPTAREVLNSQESIPRETYSRNSTSLEPVVDPIAREGVARQTEVYAEPAAKQEFTWEEWANRQNETSNRARNVEPVAEETIGRRGPINEPYAPENGRFSETAASKTAPTNQFGQEYVESMEQMGKGYKSYAEHTGQEVVEQAPREAARSVAEPRASESRFSEPRYSEPSSNEMAGREVAAREPVYQERAPQESASRSNSDWSRFNQEYMDTLEPKAPRESATRAPSEKAPGSRFGQEYVESMEQMGKGYKSYAEHTGQEVAGQELMEVKAPAEPSTSRLPRESMVREPTFQENAPRQPRFSEPTYQENVRQEARFTEPVLNEGSPREMRYAEQTRTTARGEPVEPVNRWEAIRRASTGQVEGIEMARNPSETVARGPVEEVGLGRTVISEEGRYSSLRPVEEVVGREIAPRDVVAREVAPGEIQTRETVGRNRLASETAGRGNSLETAAVNRNSRVAGRPVETAVVENMPVTREAILRSHLNGGLPLAPEGTVVEGLVESRASGTARPMNLNEIINLENGLRLQANDVRGRLMRSGEFASVEQVMDAAEKIGKVANIEEVAKATGRIEVTRDLVELRSIDQKIGELRAQRLTQRGEILPQTEPIATENARAQMEMASRTLEGPRAPIETLTNSETVRGKAMASEMVPLDGKPTMASRTPGEPLGKPVEGRSFVETLETLSRTPVTEGLAFDYLGRPTDVKLPPPSKGFTGFFEKVGNFLNGKGWQTTHEVVKTEVLSKQGAAPEVREVVSQDANQVKGRNPAIEKLNEVNSGLRETRLESHEIAEKAVTRGKVENLEQAVREANKGVQGKLPELAQNQQKVAELNTQKQTVSTEIQTTKMRSGLTELAQAKANQAQINTAKGIASDAVVKSPVNAKATTSTAKAPAAPTNTSGAKAPAAPSTSSQTIQGVPEITARAPAVNTATTAKTAGATAGEVPAANANQLQNMRAEVKSIQTRLVENGQFSNGKAVYEASVKPGVTGELAQLNTLNNQIRTIRGNSAATATSPGNATSTAKVNAPTASNGNNASTATAPKANVITETVVTNQGNATTAKAPATGNAVETTAVKPIETTAVKPIETTAVKPIETTTVKPIETTGQIASTEAAATAAKGSTTAAVTGPATDVLTNLQLRNVEITNTINGLKGSTGGIKGLFGRFFLMQNSSKTSAKLQAELTANEARITELQSNPTALAEANSQFSSNAKIQKAIGTQSKLITAYQSELAKVDPNSSYGKALQTKMSEIATTPPESFASSAKNLFLIAAGTNILMSLGRQLKSGEKLDFGEAIKSIANPGFLVGTAGVAAGAWLGTRLLAMPMASLLMTRMGAFLPPMGKVALAMLPAFVLGGLGGGLAGSLLGQRADWPLIIAQSVAGALGTALAVTMFPGLGIVGQVAGAMLGSWVAEKILHMFRGDPESESLAGGDAAGADQPTLPSPTSGDVTATIGDFTEQDVGDAFSGMQDAYQRYLDAVKSKDYEAAAVAYQQYSSHKEKVNGMRQTSFASRTGNAASSIATSN